MNYFWWKRWSLTKQKYLLSENTDFHYKSKKGPKLGKILAKFRNFFAVTFAKVYKRFKWSVITLLPLANTTTHLLRLFYKVIRQFQSFYRNNDFDSISQQITSVIEL